MAGIKDILEIEQDRKDPKDWQIINLFQEGSFYRAFSVSKVNLRFRRLAIVKEHHVIDRQV